MSKKATMLKVLLVDDNRDGADALGLLVEELGHRWMVVISFVVCA